jgi:hypothetical protein
MKPILVALLCASAIGAAVPAMAQPYYPPPPGPPGAAVAGHDFREQLDTLERRIQDGERAHQIDRGEFDRATRELGNIRDSERNMRERSGGRLNEYDRGALQTRIDQLARSIHWMRENGPGLPPPDRMPPPPPMGGPMSPPPPVVGWSLVQRETWLQQRIDRGRADGSLDRRETFRAQRALNDIKTLQAQLTRRDHGRLNETDRLYIEQRLETLRNSLHWMRENREMAPWARP